MSQIDKKALNIAFRILTYRSRTRKQLAEKMAEKQVSEEQIELICDYMEERRFIDDYDYAKNLQAGLVSRGYGTLKIKNELKCKGIDPELAGQVMEEMPDTDERLYEFIRKKCNGLDVSDPGTRKKVFDACARRGFGFEQIKSAFYRLFNADEY